MSSQTDSRAIGIFDSGLGGMTVAQAVMRAFPTEPICYLGDTARIPYGTKSPETVQLYTRQIIRFLKDQGVKFIIAACNTVSAAALPSLQDEDFGVPVIGVVEMGAETALKGNPTRVGVIGTETTISSRAYVRALEKRSPGVEVIQKACPLFVPLIEEGWYGHPVTQMVIEEYLAPMRESQIDTLILGCTHYPLIRAALAIFFGQQVHLIDSAEAMVNALHRAFDEGSLKKSGVAGENALSTSVMRENTLQSNGSRFYVTDRCNHFQTLVSAFMGSHELHVEQISSKILSEKFGDC